MLVEMLNIWDRILKIGGTMEQFGTLRTLLRHFVV